MLKKFIFKQFLDKTPEKFKTPVLQCHGDADPLIPNIWAASSSQMLQSVGFSDVKFKTYHGLGHSSTEEVINQVLKLNIKFFIFKLN